MLEPAILPNSVEQQLLPLSSDRHRTIRPIAARALHSICFWGEALLAVDPVQGYILKINPATDAVAVLNRQSGDRFLNVSSIAVSQNILWFALENEVYRCSLTDWQPELLLRMPYPVDGLAMGGNASLYVASQKSGYITIFDAHQGTEITRFAAPGVGLESLTVRGEELWVSDRTEQSVYCMDRATGELRYSILTPFKDPTGLAFHPDHDTLYVSYASDEPYVRDNPNKPDYPFELSVRDRTFIHPLYFHYDPQHHCTLSNGFLIEMTYVEEISPLDEVDLHQLEWRIALPTNTDRQRVRSVEPIGMPFTEEIHEGQRVALFEFEHLTQDTRALFGWKALVEVRSIKYQYTFDDVDKVPPLSIDLQSRYLVDDDELSMDHPLIQQAAREAIGTETNLLRKILRIRNTVYDRLSYGITTHIDPPDVVWQRGIGSCGEYVGVLLAFARLNGIACRTVGRYKCPPYGDRQRMPLEPDFNHVWIEFYVPGVGWLPMESNVDDVVDGGPYPTRFFMGLPWWHAEMAKGISFETLSTPNGSLEVSIGDLAINHIRFNILGELPPP